MFVFTLKCKIINVCVCVCFRCRVLSGEQMSWPVCCSFYPFSPILGKNLSITLFVLALDSTSLKGF